MIPEFDAQNGLNSLLLSIFVVLAINVVLKLMEFIWSSVKKREEISESSIDKLTTALQLNTQSVQRLEIRLNRIEIDLGEVPKVKAEIRKLYSAMKHLSGESWDQVKSAMNEDVIL